MPGKLYLIPNSIGSPDATSFLPQAYMATIVGLKYLIVEDVRNARRYLKSLDRSVVIDDIHFYALNKHTAEEDIAGFLHPLLKGNDMGIISEAGLPGIADPGAVVVRLAHDQQIQVVPMVGPSSIFLALMASGLNGQNFRFCGYLPVDKTERIKEIKRLEKRVFQENETQIFIETPYRNEAMFEALVSTCKPMTLMTVAVDLNTENEQITTKAVAKWNTKKPALHKRPAVFLLGK